MPQIKNVSPLGDLDVPLLGRVVKAGDVADVTPDQARRLLPQDIWAAVDDAAHAIQAELDKPADDGEVTDDDPAV